jgi:hypothetical protein
VSFGDTVGFICFECLYYRMDEAFKNEESTIFRLFNMPLAHHIIMFRLLNMQLAHYIITEDSVL